MSENSNAVEVLPAPKKVIVEDIFFKRSMASLIELLAFSMTYQVVCLVSFIPAIVVGGYIQQTNDSLSKMVGFPLMGIGIVLSFVYLIHRIAKNKQMLGYKIMGLKVVNVDGSELSYKKWMVRNILKLILVVPAAASIWISVLPLGISRGKRDILDYFVGTKAVKL